MRVRRGREGGGSMGRRRISMSPKWGLECILGNILDLLLNLGSSHQVPETLAKWFAMESTEASSQDRRRNGRELA